MFDRRVEDNTTRATARLPGLDIEIIHRRALNNEAEHVRRFAVVRRFERGVTLKGESLIREVSKRVDEIGEIILKPFNPDERTALLKLLAKSAQSVDEQGEQPRASARRRSPA